MKPRHNERAVRVPKLRMNTDDPVIAGWGMGGSRRAQWMSVKVLGNGHSFPQLIFLPKNFSVFYWGVFNEKVEFHNGSQQENVISMTVTFLDYTFAERLKMTPDINSTKW